ncbi:rhodanese-related sulfurtransferase [Aestuariivirga litoralis]|uniref:tRNA uridine(34) hydroxylase n=1 Tax=Aestuariivirga litoralis TaxID=2650924 RepID=A0A2W2AYF2_9HYPH|nr:rhodanese-related sulfurtransferase [Aestuariivirga litoralis]
MIAVSAFYKFVHLPQFAELRPMLLDAAKARGIRGTILLAAEGINGTIAGAPDDLVAMMVFIRAIPAFAGLESKESHAESMPFQRMKVRLKKEIVTMGVQGLDPAHVVGTYVAPEDWNALISDPDVLVIDTRNSFEFAAGTFAHAVDPQTKSFGEFPAYVQRELGAQKDRPIAMFCTGGIRCEKATSYLRSQGFGKVYHLKGGILKYLEVIPPEQSLWQGSCFVFDEREGLGHGLEIVKPED